MARIAPALVNMNGGEVSSLFLGRIDLEGYKKSLKRALNVALLPLGGWTRRPGTKFVVAPKSGGTPTLIPWEFNASQTFVWEIGASYMRLIDGVQKAQVTVANTTAAITNGAFGTNITGWTDASDVGASIAHDGTNFRMSLISASAASAYAKQTVTVPTATLHVLGFRVYGAPVKLRIGTGDGGEQLLADTTFGIGWHRISFTTSGTSAYLRFGNEDETAAITAQLDDIAFLDDQAWEIVAPWTEADARKIRYAQAYDLMYLACEGYRPYKLIRRNNTSWSLEEYDFKDGPYLAENVDEAWTMAPSSTALGSITMVATKPTFAASDVGRIIRVGHPQDNEFSWGWGVITAVASNVSATVNARRTFHSTGASRRWRLGAWSDGQGWPHHVCFYEDRLFWARCTESPQTVWATMTGAYESFDPSSREVNTASQNVDRTNPDNGLVLTLNSDRANPIEWMAPAAILLVGTASGEFGIQASSLNEGLTPDNASAKPQSSAGSANVAAARIDGRVLFVQQNGRKLIELAYDLNANAYDSGDATLFAGHMLKGVANRLCWQAEPHAQLWVSCDDGSLRALTYMPRQQVIGWARHTLGGTAPAVKSMCALSGSRQDTVWLLVERTINGVTAVGSIEYVVDYFSSEQGDDLTDAFFVDCGLTYDSTPATSITGLSHLEGETVAAIGDGFDLGDFTVASGAITLPRACSVVHVGLLPESEVETAPNVLGAQNGSAARKRQTGIEADIRFVDTVGGEYGRIDSDGSEWFEANPEREAGDALDQPPPLFSGVRRLPMPAGYDSELTHHIRQTRPLPMTVAAILPTIVVADS